MPAIEKANKKAEVPKVEEKKNSGAVSIAELYAELEAELLLRGENSQNVGITSRIRETMDGVFEATQKDRLLLSAMVRVVEKQEGKKKLYNLVRSVAASKSKTAKYGLETVDGRAYIVRK